MAAWLMLLYHVCVETETATCDFQFYVVGHFYTVIEIPATQPN